MAAPYTPPPPILCRGARAAEARLLAELDRLLAQAEADPALLARPLRVVVPSRSLRRHLSETLMRRRRRAAIGVSIQTHFALALEVIEGAGEAVRSGRHLFELLPQRLARRERVLRRPLEGLVDGYGAVVATVRDLLDAGFEPTLAAGLDEALAADGRPLATADQIARGRALLRVAAGTWDALEAEELGDGRRLLARAVELLELHGEELLPARGVLVHGFADATGVVTDLLQALQRRLGARVVLDRPAGPAADPGLSPAAPGPGERFGERFVERLTLAAAPEPDPADPPPPAEIDLFTARGTEGEVREVARRISRLLETGARPAAIAVAARDPSPYRADLRRHFDRLGIPFSTPGETGALTPAGRRAAALLDLLRRGGLTPAERWLDALERLPAAAGPLPPVPMELRLAFASLGAGRLDQVAGLDVEGRLAGRSGLPLPIRQGLRGGADPEAEDEPEEGDAGETDREGPAPRLPRRVLGRELLAAAVGAAGDLTRRLAGWPRRLSLGEHRRRLETLLTDDLGWRPEPEGGSALVLGALATLEAEAPGGFTLDFEELRLVLGRALEDLGGSALGGAGGGVQVLSVTEARARTFDHLFLLGLNRGAFPRPIREDPLLPDDLRRVLRPLLPDIPVKASGFDEERYLFAQLLSASPRVTLSWQSFDQAGSPRSPSPLVERFATHRPPAAEPAWAPAAHPTPPRPAAEAATLAALWAPRERFRRLLPLAVAEARGPLEGALPLAAGELAAARCAVLDELDPDLAGGGGGAAFRPGPYFGFLGALGTPVDPRRHDLWVTTLERLAGCPWQVFLHRLLGVEPTPDPLRALPGADPLLVGATVHRVLERIARSGAAASHSQRPTGYREDGAQSDPRRGREAFEHRPQRYPVGLEGSPPGEPHPPPWPGEAELAAWLTEAATELLLTEGFALPGMGRALARASRPYLDAAREVDWRGGPPAVRGVETEGHLTVRDGAGGERRVRFRADRVDGDGGALRITDYKTGRPLRRGGREPRSGEKLRQVLLADLAAGTRLQAAAYARAAGAAGAAAVGRYLFLRPEVENRVVEIRGDDEEAAGVLTRVAAALLDLWDRGAFFPRVVDPEGEKEPPRCSFCPVAEACLRGDSGARLRLLEWARRQGEAEAAERGAGRPGPTAAEEALLAVWRLPARGRGDRP